MNIRQDVYKEIADKAAKDESFMNQFKTDPAKAVEDFIAGNCSSEERAEITSAYTSSLSTEEGSRELNESELEHVSGGYHADVGLWLASKIIKYFV